MKHLGVLLETNAKGCPRGVILADVEEIGGAQLVLVCVAATATHSHANLNSLTLKRL